MMLIFRRPFKEPNECVGEVGGGWKDDEWDEWNAIPPTSGLLRDIFTMIKSQISILESPSEQRYPFLSLVATTTSLRNDYQCE